MELPAVKGMWTTSLCSKRAENHQDGEIAVICVCKTSKVEQATETPLTASIHTNDIWSSGQINVVF